MRLKPVLLPLCMLALCACTTTSPPAEDNSEVTGRGAGKDNWWDKLPRPAWAAFEPVPQPQDWFEVYRVAAGVYAIYEPGQFEEVISYLITGDAGAVLFDTGLGIGDIRRLAGQLTDGEIWVVNSHSHYDHIGGNHAFATVLAADSDYTRRRARGLAHAEVAHAVGPGWIWKTTPEGFDRDRYAIAGYTLSGVLADGDVIDLGGRRLEVVLTPGHAPDALCLLDRDNRLLWTGDTFYPAPLYTHLEGSDFGLYAASAARLAGLASEVDFLLPGHNVPLVPADYLGKMHDAFQQIQAGEAGYVLTDGLREYPFDGFSVLTRDGPPRPSLD